MTTAGPVPVTVVAGDGEPVAVDGLAAGGPDIACARRPGRPRNEGAEGAVTDAILACLVEEGYAGMSIERVAARAGVSRATVYRRWPTKAEMVIDAIRRRSFDQVQVTDTGDVRADLESLLTQVQGCMSSEHAIIQALHVEQRRHAELGEVFRTRFVAERRAVVEALLRRAVERGQLAAGSDIELLATAGPAIIWQQLTLLEGPPDPALPGRIVDLLVPRTG